MGFELAGTEIGVCATSQFPQTLETADIALLRRDVPWIVLATLNDIVYGALEGENRKR